MERLSLSNRTFEGSNNAYLFDGAETVLVDTGDRLPETREQLTETLATHGVELTDIDKILLTHWHGDHRGLAGQIQDESGATVFVHTADAPLVAGENAAWEQMSQRQQSYFRQWGMPEEKQEELMEILDSVSWRENPPSVTEIEHGERITAGSRTFRAVHAPGHSAGLCMFETEIDGEHAVLTGDALLPKYTPNVGGADVRVENPLDQYLETLQAIIEAEYDCAWPGHREPITDPGSRAAFIIDHHEQRAWRVLDVLDRHGPCDAWTVSDHLFGELEQIHILHGPGEAYAHLSHLEREGIVCRQETAYDLTDGVSAQLDQRDRWPLLDR